MPLTRLAHPPSHSPSSNTQGNRASYFWGLLEAAPSSCTDKAENPRRVSPEEKEVTRTIRPFAKALIRTPAEANSWRDVGNVETSGKDPDPLDKEQSHLRPP